MRVRFRKREFVWKFTQLLWPDQTRPTVAWELMSVDWILPRALLDDKRNSEINKQSLYFTIYFACVKLSSTLMTVKATKNSHQNLNLFEVDESWWGLAKMSENCNSYQLFSTVILVWRGSWRLYLYDDIPNKFKIFSPFLSQVSNLFARDEIDEICGELIPVMKKEYPRRPPTPENLYDYFLTRAKRNLHVALCFSPVSWLHFYKTS